MRADPGDLVDVTRIAICSDIHGNLSALEAVLAQAEDAGCDQLWVVGDLAAHGPRPGPVVRRLQQLTGSGVFGTVRVVRGNTDRYVTSGDLSPYLLALDPEQVPDKGQLVAASRAAFAWTRERVAEVGGLGWLAGLPTEALVPLPDGSRVLLVHASPGTDDGPGLFPELDDDGLRAAGVTAAGAELVVAGHTHVPMDRQVDGIRVVNLGSVSVPVTDELRAMWTLLTAGRTGWVLEHRRAAYDLEAALADLHRVGHPSAHWLEGKIRRVAG